MHTKYYHTCICREQPWPTYSSAGNTSIKWFNSWFSSVSIPHCSPPGLAHLPGLLAVPWCALASWPKFKRPHFVPHFPVAIYLGFCHHPTALKKMLSGFVQKQPAHEFFSPCVVSARRAGFWRGIWTSNPGRRLRGSNLKGFPCTLVKWLLQKLQEKPLHRGVNWL